MDPPWPLWESQGTPPPPTSGPPSTGDRMGNISPSLPVRPTPPSRPATAGGALSVSRRLVGNDGPLGDGSMWGATSPALHSSLAMSSSSNNRSGSPKSPRSPRSPKKNLAGGGVGSSTLGANIRGGEVIDMEEVQRSIRQERLHKKVDHFIYNYQRKQREEHGTAKALLDEAAVNAAGRQKAALEKKAKAAAVAAAQSVALTPATAPPTHTNNTTTSIAKEEKKEKVTVLGEQHRLAPGLQGLGGCFHRCHPTEGSDRQVLRAWFGRIKEYNHTLREQAAAPYLYSFTGDNEEEEIERRQVEEQKQFALHQQHLQREKKIRQRQQHQQQIHQRNLKNNSSSNQSRSLTKGATATTTTAIATTTTTAGSGDSSHQNGARTFAMHSSVSSSRSLQSTAVDSLTRMASKKSFSMLRSPRNHNPTTTATSTTPKQPQPGDKKDLSASRSSGDLQLAGSAVFGQFIDVVQPGGGGGGPHPPRQRRRSTVTTVTGAVAAPTLFKGLNTTAYMGKKRPVQAEPISSTCAFPRF